MNPSVETEQGQNDNSVEKEPKHPTVVWREAMGIQKDILIYDVKSFLLAIPEGSCIVLSGGVYQKNSSVSYMRIDEKDKYNCSIFSSASDIEKMVQSLLTHEKPEKSTDDGKSLNPKYKIGRLLHKVPVYTPQETKDRKSGLKGKTKMIAGAVAVIILGAGLYCGTRKTSNHNQSNPSIVKPQ